MSQEKVAIVTAGGSGMGAAAARRLAADGFRIAILSSSGKGAALAEEFGGVGVTGMDMKDGDYIEHLFVCSSHDYLLFFSNRGKVYRSKVYELPEGTRAVLDAGSWPVPPVFAWLARTGGVAADEMVRVFNCGVGMAAVVAEADADAALALLAEHGETACRIGRIEAGDGPAAVHIERPEGWPA